MPIAEVSKSPATRTDPGPPAPRHGGASLGWDLLYGLIAILGLPIVLMRRFGKDREGWRQKWGHVPKRPAHPKRIWIHAVSVGEAKAASTLFKALRTTVPEAEIVFSTTTRTGQQVARQLYGEASVFYFPYDFSWAVRRSFDAVKPTLVVLMELEVWPNLTAEALARGIPVVVVNGRITERSAHRYGRGWGLIGPSFNRVRRWLMQSDEYAQRLTHLGVETQRIEVTGNIKYDDVEAAPVPAEQRAEMLAALAFEPEAQVLMGGSTHPSEEGSLLDAYRVLKVNVSGLRLVLAPRHPERLAAVEAEILARGLPCVRRSALAAQGAKALDGIAVEQRGNAVVLVDTMGELKRLYRAANVVFVGGSLIPHGGQNVTEPAGMGLPVIFGPHMHNFNEAVSILSACDGAVTVPDAAALPAALEELFSHPEHSSAMGARARAAFLQRQGATERCVGYLRELLGTD